MLLYLLAFVGGVLTIVSPCILPVLPFVFSRADQPFRRSGLPLLGGMAIMFALVSAVAAFAGTWIVRANQIGRVAAMVIFAVLGVSLLIPSFAEFLSRPFVRLGGKVRGTGDEPAGVGRSLLLGVSTGLLWAPCAGPILGLILTGAVVEGPTAHTAFLLVAFALGAACSLAVALLAGGKVFAMMKRSLGAEEWIRRGLGVAVLVGVIAIASGWDRGVLQRLSLASTSGIEQRLLDRVHPQADTSTSNLESQSGGAMTALGGQSGPAMTGPAMTGPAMTSTAGQGPAMTATGGQAGPSMTGPAMTGPAMTATGGAAGPAMTSTTGQGPAMMAMVSKSPQTELKDEGTFPSLSGAVTWLNSPPLSTSDLKGKVVLIDFWTYSCINCLRAIPYVEASSEKYKADGLVVIGVHTPEFAFEKDTGNVAKAVRDLKISYPVAVDSNYAIWRAFHNNYWPAHYFIDGEGKIRYHHFGEGEYDQSEKIIQQLLREKNGNLQASGLVKECASGAQAAADLNNLRSPETYIGYARTDNYLSPETIAKDAPASYTTPGRMDVNNWGLGGKWNVSAERAMLAMAPGKIVFRFHARDLHLVLGPGKDGKPVRFRVLLDGAPPAGDHGADADAQGNGTVKDYRLYQLIRQKGKIEDRTFQIEFLDPGVQAFAFTFG